MAVIGFSIKRMDARKDKDQANSQITVNSTPTIVELKEIDIPSLSKKAISIQYEFITRYETDVGTIKVEGDLLYLSENGNKEILDKWKKDKTLPDGVSLEVLNTLFRRCLTKIVSLAEDLQLPPPVQFPILKLKSEEQKNS
ncbi:MAG TPA: hypothetical protein VJA47_06530 [archaeon]|nr:hypothetical protein [archaeon]